MRAMGRPMPMRGALKFKTGEKNLFPSLDMGLKKAI